MANNPLQQYFRQPKIYVGLPSKGIFNKIGSVQGDVTNMPVYGMTGSDEIIMKTPDALMSGHSTVKVIESCCPFIKDAWEMSAVDIELVLAAIRIATYGNEITVSHTCTECKASNDYDLDLSTFIDHFRAFVYNNSIRVGALTVRLQPLTYRISTTFANRNYEMRKQLQQVATMTDPVAQQALVTELYEKLGNLQTEIFNNSIESVETSTETVTDREFIMEWINNCDKSFFDAIKAKFDENRSMIKAPPFKAKCDACGHESDVTFELDESNFFVNA